MADNEVKVVVSGDSVSAVAALGATTKEADKLKTKVNETSQAIRNIPDVKIDVDDTDAKLMLKEFKLELDTVHGKTVHINVDTDKDILPEVTKLGDDVGKKFQKATSSGFKKSGGLKEIFTQPEVLAALAPALVPLGAMVGGALLNGIGLIGIGAGIAGQLHDPAVVRAATTLGHDVSSGFKEATSAFAEPVRVGLNDLDSLWKDMQPRLRGTFTQLAPLVTDLEKGVAGFIGKLVPGLEDAAIASKPLVQTFSKWLPEIGSQLGSLFETLGDNAGALNDGLKLLLGIISLIVYGLNGAISVGSKLFEVAKWTTGLLHAVVDLGGSGDDTTTKLDKLAKTTNDAGSAASDAAPDYDALSTALNKTENNADTLAGKMADKLFNSLLTSDNAALHLAESQTALSKAISENGHQLDIHTSKGQSNREAVLGVVQANIAQYDAMLQAGMSATDAAAAYDANTAALQKQLHQLGFNQAQIDGLIGKYKQVPDKVDTEIAMEGLTDAINSLDDLLRDINHLPSRKDIIVNTTYVENRQSVYNQQVPKYKAAGGVVGAARDTWVGEDGPERLTLPVGSTVTPSGQSRDQAAAASNGDGATNGGIMEIKFSGNVDGAFATAFMMLVRTGQITISPQAVR